MALIFASASLTIALMSVVLSVYLGDVRDTQARQIRPNLKSPDGRSASLLVSYSGLPVLGERGALVVSLWPLSPSAPPPPGVSRWPRPGEVAISPALLSDLGDSKRDLFGTVAEVIDPSGLETPHERRVYRVPPREALDESTMQPAYGFGGFGDDVSWFGLDQLNAKPQWMVLLAIGWGFVAPSSIAVALASALGADRRSQRRWQFAAIGIGGRPSSLIELWESAPPLFLGCILGVLPVAPFYLWDISLSWLDITFASHTMRSAWAFLLLSGLISLIVSAGLVLLSGWTLSKARSIRSAASQTLPIGRATLSLCAALATIWIPLQSESAPIRTISYTTGVVLVAVTLPATLACLLAAIGKIFIWAGLRMRSAVAILGGRSLQFAPRRSARILLGVCAGILLLGQSQLWAGLLGQDYRQAVQARSELGMTYLYSANNSYGKGIERFIHEMPSTVGPVWTWSEDSGGERHSYLSGSCQSIAALGLKCLPSQSIDRSGGANRALSSVLAMGSIESTLTVKQEAAPDLHLMQEREGVLGLVSLDGADLPIERLQSLGYATTPDGLQLSSLGAGEIAAGRLKLISARWATLWSLLGAIAIVTATGLFMTGDLIASADNLAPLSVMVGRRRWLQGVAAIRIGLPVAVAGVFGAFYYYYLPLGVESSGQVYFTPSKEFATGAIGAALVVAAVISSFGGYHLLTLSRRWRPGVSSQG